MAFQAKIVDSHNSNTEKFISTSTDLGLEKFEVKHNSVPSGSHAYQVALAPTSGSTWGDKLLFRLPKSGVVHDISIKMTFSTISTDTYSNYIGAHVIDEIEIKNGGNRQQDNKFDISWLYLRSRLTYKLEAKHLVSAGGTGMQTGYRTHVLIPTFFSGNLSRNEHPGVNLAALKSDLEVYVQLKTLANSLVNGGGTDSPTISDIKLICWMSSLDDESQQLFEEMHDDNRYFYGLHFTTKDSSALTTGVTNTMQFSCNGSLKEAILINRSVANYQTAKQSFTLSQIDNIIARVDGTTEEYIYDANDDAIAQTIYNQVNGSGASDYLYPIPFCDEHTGRDTKMHNFVNSLAKSSYNQLEFDIDHSVGANSIVTVFALEDALYQYRDGLLYLAQ